MRPPRAQSSTVDFGIARSEATSLDVITSVRVSGPSLLADETSTLVKPTARGWETAPETRLLTADAQTGERTGVPRASGAPIAVANAQNRPPATTPGTTKAPPEQGFREERLKGLEPSTFCMASRRSSQLSYSRARRRV